MELLVQFLVLAFTGALWWLARRDLAARAAPSARPEPAPESPELEQILGTLETLVTELTRRMERVEARVAQLGSILPGTEVPVYPEETPPGLKKGNQFASSVPQGLSPNSPALQCREYAETAPDAPVYALLAEGVTDPQELARRTGLSRGEIDLILSLRARSAL